MSDCSRSIASVARVHSFANRTNSAFITPDEVETLERWAGKSVLTALAKIKIDEQNLHPNGVWSK